MTDFPEKILVCHEDDSAKANLHQMTVHDLSAIVFDGFCKQEYIRADLHTAEINVWREDRYRMSAERDGLKYELRVRELEAEGLTRSDAQSVADVEAEKGGRP